MPSPFSHAVAGMAFAPVLLPLGRQRRPLLLGAACAVVPDLDVLSSLLGIDHHPLLGHRALSHSPCFAVVFAAAVTWLAFREDCWDGLRGRIWLYLSVAMVSHGLLDALTSYGQGVTLLAPFSLHRIKLPWHPITGTGWGFGVWWGHRALALFKVEFVWIWLPATGLALAGVLGRRLGRRLWPRSAP